MHVHPFQTLLTTEHHNTQTNGALLALTTLTLSIVIISLNHQIDSSMTRHITNTRFKALLIRFIVINKTSELQNADTQMCESDKSTSCRTRRK